MDKQKQDYETQLQNMGKDYDDQLAEALAEREKDYALILDSKIIEHEDQILDTENCLHREYIDKISQYQEIIKTIKNENQALCEENSLKQTQIDQNFHVVNHLKEDARIKNLQYEQLMYTIGRYDQQKDTHPDVQTPQSFKQRPSSVWKTYSQIDSNNKENDLSNISSLPPQKHPIDNLKGYWHKMKNKKSSRTRNSDNYMNSAINIQAASHTNLPTGNKMSVKRSNTSFNGCTSKSMLRDNKPHYSNKMRANNKRGNQVSLSSKFVNDLRESKWLKDSTYLEIDTESEKDRTPVKSMISSLETNTQDKKNKILKEAYNTLDSLNSAWKQKVENDRFGLGGMTYDNTYKDFVDDTFDDGAADIEDSMCLDEVAVSQRSINASFINIKRNKPLEYKLKHFTG
jgi:hypothetical protein